MVESARPFAISHRAAAAAMVVLALSVGVSIVAAAPSSEGPETYFDGVAMRRIGLELRGDPDAACAAAARIESAIDIQTKRRSPHPWSVVAPTVANAITSGAHPAHESVRTLIAQMSPQGKADGAPDHRDALEAIGALRRGPNAVNTASRRVRMVTFEFADDSNKASTTPRTYAHSFDDPRVVRLHSGHDDPTIDEFGNTRAHEVSVMRRMIDRALGKSGLAETTNVKESHMVWPSAVEPMWVPQAVRKIRLYCANLTTPDVELTVPSHPSHKGYHAHQRAFAAANAGGRAAPEVRTLYAAGPPSRTYNIIFNAAGYRLQDRDMFFNNASNVSALMHDPSLDPNLAQDSDNDVADMHKTVPFNRYWLNWNIYAVFQASVDAGADRPMYGIDVDNNLDCVHPKDMERAVQCDPALSVALAAASPADVTGDPDRCVIVNLVNTHLYGGSASGRALGKYQLGNFFNGFDLNDGDHRKRMLSLTNHELGHAFGDLMDEYSLGIPEPSGRVFANCEAEGNVPSRMKWQPWIDLKNSMGAAAFKAQYAPDVSDSTWGILNSPEAVCGYTNYYKANTNCMMHRLRDFFMCPVCREASTKHVLRVRFDLEWPRKPLRDIVTVIAPRSHAFNGSTTAPSDNILTEDGEVVLHLAAHLTRGYTVTATDYDGANLPLLHTQDCYNCIRLNGTNFAKYPKDTIVSLRVDIVDSTDNSVIGASLTALQPQTHQNTTFRLYVASDMTALQASRNVTLAAGNRDAVVGRHISDLQRAYSFCEGEDGNTNRSELVCDMQFPNRTYERPLDVEGALATYDDWVLIGLAGLAVLFLLLWAYAATACTDNANQQARTIFKTKHSCIITLIRRVMMLSAVLFLVASVVAIGLSGYYYTSSDALGKILLAVGVVIAVVLYLLAFFGFWAVVSRSKRMLVINKILLILAFGVLLFVFILVIEVGKELQVESSFTVDMGDVSAQGAVNGNPTGGSSQSASDQNGYWTNQLFNLWTDLVQDDPGTACAIQGMLKCSGFYTNCASDYASTLTCPKHCESTNKRFLSPCLSLLKGYIVDHYEYIAGATGTSAGLLLCGILLNTILLVALCCQKQDVQKSNQSRIAEAKKRGPLALRRRPGAAAAAGGAGAGAAAAAAGMPQALGKQEEDAHHALYLLKSLDSTTTSSLVREFKRIDIDGNGELDRKELFVFFKKVLMYKPSSAELDVIFEQADIDGDGTISLVEFLKLFGTENAEELVQQINSPRRQRRVPVPPVKLPMIRRKSADPAMSGSGRRKSSAGHPKQGDAAPANEAPLLAVPHAEVPMPESASSRSTQPQPFHANARNQQQPQSNAKADPFAEYDDLL
uniref:EF-hand domain-containing protein n=1 Tax=Neobodo designis TaxID=312471 RepID=A0A7S1QQT3_NEODS|mmetsp:Transcript_50193/g.155070  ORF Transcript_50193/g.155070 Transcript_50193/m.155070 type:complete len:1339 (+) Transcript_50193:44-4060(+)